MKKKILCLFLAVINLLGAFTVFVSADQTVTIAEIDSTSVLDDLEKFQIDITEYQKNENATHGRVLYFLEYAYDYHGLNDEYGLYFYVWNPSGKALRESGHYVQMRAKATLNSDTVFSKYALELLDVSAIEGYENVFLKFKVKDPSVFLDTVNRDLRYYEISGVTVAYQEHGLKEFAFGSLYGFRGFQPYRGEERLEENTLRYDVTDRLVLDLELHPTSWKTHDSDKGEGYQYEIFSVYFSVPNDVIKHYGNDENELHSGLVRLDGDYVELKINGLATQEQDLYDRILPQCGIKVNDGLDSILKADLDFGLNGGYRNTVNGLTVEGGFALNSDGIGYTKHINYRAVDRLCTVIKYDEEESSEGGFELLSSSGLYTEIMKNMTYHDGLSHLGYLDTGKEPGYQTYYVAAGEDLSEQVATYASQFSEFQKTLLFIFSGGYYKDYDYSGMHSIQTLSNANFYLDGVVLTDEAFSEKYFVNTADVDALKRYVASEEAKGNTTFMVRFAARDYYCMDSRVSLYGSGGNDIPSGNGNYYFEKTIFLNFDVMTTTWEDKYGGITVIPVSASPINHVGTLTKPLGPEFTFLGQDLLESVFGLLEKGGTAVTTLKNLKPFILVIGLLFIIGLILFVFWILDKLGIPIWNLMAGLGRGSVRVVGLVGSFITGLFDRKEERRRSERDEARKDRAEARQDRLDRESSEDRAWSRSRQERLDRQAKKEAKWRHETDQAGMDLKIKEDTRRQEVHDHNKENWE